MSQEIVMGAPEEMSTSEINLRVTGQSSQGGRKYMEDAFVVAYQHTEDKKDLEYAFFGIFDGHGGKEAAQYAKNNLLDNIVCLKHFWQDDDDLILSAIRDGFLNTHMAMWKEVENWPKTASGLPSTAGTTASVAFIRKGKLYTGHVGDSRIVIGLKDQDNEEWQAESLTIDHKPESPVEKQRIIDSGGLVMNKSGVERVVWKRPKPGHEGPILRSTDFEKIPFLAVARSLGDLWSYDYFQQEFAVSPEPDLGVMSLDLNKDKCLILASDGLWNIMSPQDAVHLVQDVENENGKLILKFGVSENIHLTLCNPSRVLVDCSLERWNQLRTRADNVSVLTVLLDETKSSETGSVLRQQLVLKMNYPRSLPVWDVGLRCRSASDCCTSGDVDEKKDMTEAETNYLRAALQKSSCDKCGLSYSSHGDTNNPSSSNSKATDSLSQCVPNCCRKCEAENHIEDGNLSKSCNCFFIKEETINPTDRLTNSPLQSCSNFLPEYCPEGFSSKSSKTDAEGIENSPCQFPRWSKSASGRTSLSKLATWSRVVSHRRMSDPFPSQRTNGPRPDVYSLSDDENSNPTFQSNISQKSDGQTTLEEMGFERDLCDEDDIVASANFVAKYGNSELSAVSVTLEELGFERDLCDDDETSRNLVNMSDTSTDLICGKSNFVEQNFRVCMDQLSSIKQAIKRKYPGTEISQSFISSSCRTEKCEADNSQKRKLDISSNLLKINSVVSEVNS